MKIVDIQRFINKIKLITEATTLPQIRRGIVGKDYEYPVIKDDKEWYENHKEEILSTLKKALNVDDKTLKIKLQKFDTDPYFTDDKPRELKVRELLKAVRKNFISQVERSRNTEEKTTGIEAQYEMMKIGNGVEVYAVYTPMANRYLTHTRLYVDGCYSPSWCIASSTANNYWNMYHLYEAKYPSVFIVAQKTKNVYTGEKYELKCNPYKSVSFKEGEISLKEWVDEWRDPKQNEKTHDETSLFKTFNISSEDLEDVIRKLVNSKKAETFSEKFGKEMLELYTQKINSKDEDTRMEYLTKACKNGTFVNFCNRIDKEDKDYFLDELIRYETLTEMEIEEMRIMDNKKALLNLIKNKRCGHKSLEWANLYFNVGMLKKVYYSLSEDILLLEYFEGINVRNKILQNIKHVDELLDSFISFLIQKDKINIFKLFIFEDDEKMYNKVVEKLIKKDKIDDSEFYLIRFENLNIELIEKLIKNGKFDASRLYYVEADKELYIKILEILMKNDKFNASDLNYVNDELYINTLEILIKDDKFNTSDLYLLNDKKLYGVCVDLMIKYDKINDKIFYYIEDDQELCKKCVKYLILNYDSETTDIDILKYVDDEDFCEECLDYLIRNKGKEQIDTYYIDSDKKLCNIFLKCLIKNDILEDHDLWYFRKYEDICVKCVNYLIKNNNFRVNLLYYVKHHKNLYQKCIDYLINRGIMTRYDLEEYVCQDEELRERYKDYLKQRGVI